MKGLSRAKAEVIGAIRWRNRPPWHQINRSMNILITQLIIASKAPRKAG
jgi:hypothetical protein